MTPTVGVLLSGCGVFDGSEIHEAVLTLLALDRAGATILCMAPNRPQHHVIDHLVGKPTDEQRNVLVEAARIARGAIRDVATVKAEDLDALILPGGFGAAKNLCTFATDGPKCDVDPGVERLVRNMHDARKPLGFLCIAPALAARVLGSHHVKLTIGCDEGTAQAITSLGARHENAPVSKAIVDEEHRVVSAPAYMYGRARISEVAEGIDALVAEVLRLAGAEVGSAR